MKKFGFLFFITLFSLQNFAQKAIIRGTVTDNSTGETLPFANVYLKNNTSIGTTTDLDGNYTLKLKPGTFTIIFSFTSFKDDEQNITVRSGQTIQLNSALSTASEVLETVVIVAEKKKAKTIAAFDRKKMKATNMLDGTSKEQIRKTGDNDAGQVMKRITGVSVEDGKNVFVRGLGDRYTKTTLNGMAIPGLDPDKNSVQMDIFPTQLIDNIVVYKTFTPNLPGDFTGGMVDIQTRDFPSTKNINFSSSLGYNTVATFNKDFILYKGGALDWAGIDNGTRSLPFSKKAKFPDPVVGNPVLTTLTSKFDRHMAVQNKNNFLNQRYSFAVGNQFNSEKHDLDYGFNFVLTYKNNYTFYKKSQFNVYLKDPNKDNNEMTKERTSIGPQGINDVMWSTLLGQSIKFNKKHKISFNLFHTQNGVSSAAKLTQQNFDSNPAVIIKDNLQYTQRMVTNASVIGKHVYDKWRVDWKLSPTRSSIKDPDIRSAAVEYIAKDSTFYLNKSVGAELRRIFRNLNEINLSERVDFTYKTLQWDSLETKFSFGFLDTYKKRNYEVFNYIFEVRHQNKFDGNADEFFAPQNIWTVQSDTGTYGRGQRELANTYEASQNVIGGYLMNELPITEKLKSVYGLRVEQVTNLYTGQNNTGSVIYNNKKVLNQLDFLPAVNFVYNLKDTIGRTTNLRFSFTQTIARPSFREKSIAQIFDPIQGRRYNGNIDLKETHIQNIDFRWESFFGRTETVSFSSFYKRLQDPIEVASFDVSPNEFIPVNAGVANLLGIELESRKRIGFKDQNWKKLYVGANFTYVYSRLDMSKVMVNRGFDLISQYEIRKSNARTGENVSKFRTMAGQSPYIINVYVNFTHDSLDLDFNISYNVQGERLSIVGIGSLPDVYQKPFNSLNLKVSKRFGKYKQWRASVRAQNILLSTRKRMYQSYQAKNQVFDSFYKGSTYSFSVAYSFRPKNDFNN